MSLKASARRSLTSETRGQEDGQPTRVWFYVSRHLSFGVSHPVRFTFSSLQVLSNTWVLVVFCLYSTLRFVRQHDELLRGTKPNFGGRLVEALARAVGSLVAVDWRWACTAQQSQTPFRIVVVVRGQRDRTNTQQIRNKPVSTNRPGNERTAGTVVLLQLLADQMQQV